jgi:hypothetical protein
MLRNAQVLLSTKKERRLDDRRTGGETRVISAPRNAQFRGSDIKNIRYQDSTESSPLSTRVDEFATGVEPEQAARQPRKPDRRTVAHQPKSPLRVQLFEQYQGRKLELFIDWRESASHLISPSQERVLAYICKKTWLKQGIGTYARFTIPELCRRCNFDNHTVSSILSYLFFYGFLQGWYDGQKPRVYFLRVAQEEWNEADHPGWFDPMALSGEIPDTAMGNFPDTASMGEIPDDPTSEETSNLSSPDASSLRTEYEEGPSVDFLDESAPILLEEDPKPSYGLLELSPNGVKDLLGKTPNIVDATIELSGISPFRLSGVFPNTARGEIPNTANALVEPSEELKGKTPNSPHVHVCNTEKDSTRENHVHDTWQPTRKPFGRFFQKFQQQDASVIDGVTAYVSQACSIPPLKRNSTSQPATASSGVQKDIGQIIDEAKAGIQKTGIIDKYPARTSKELRAIFDASQMQAGQFEAFLNRAIATVAGKSPEWQNVGHLKTTLKRALGLPLTAVG